MKTSKLRALRRVEAEAALALVTFFWGSTFVVVQKAIREVPVLWFLTLRFAAATAIILPIAWLGRARGRHAREAFRACAGAGAFLGVLYFLGYLFQTQGLQTTSSTKSAFITETLVIWTPIMGLAVYRRRPSAETLVCVPLGLGGLYLLLFEKGWASLAAGGWVIGDMLTLACAIAFAAHIVATRKLSFRHAIMPLVATQLATITALSLAGSLLAGETRGFGYSPSIWGILAFVAIFPTALATWTQTHMQQFTSAERASIIFLLEPLFAALTAYAVDGETLSGRQWIGGGIVLLAAIIPEAISLARMRQIPA